jgi:hypothetical protein
MKWHDHPSLVDGYARNWWNLSGSIKETFTRVFAGRVAKVVGLDIPVNIRTVEDTRRFLQKPPKLVWNAVLNQLVQLQSEHDWVEARRPYYNIYPSVAEAFTKVDLSKVDCSMIKLPVQDLMIRFQVGRELYASKTTKVRSILVRENVTIYEKRGWLAAINTGVMSGEIPVHTVVGCRMQAGTTIADHLQKGRAMPLTDDTIDTEAVDNVFRLVATLCLLKDNPEIIEPIPLEADRAKWDRNHDPALIDKAARRGNRGWSVGAHIDVAPGFRRPHFAIRWCGPGGRDPQVRPIKGCLVHRQKITEVPTGHLDDVVDAIIEDE